MRVRTIQGRVNKGSLHKGGGKGPLRPTWESIRPHRQREARESYVDHMSGDLRKEGRRGVNTPPHSCQTSLLSKPSGKPETTKPTEEAHGGQWSRGKVGLNLEGQMHTLTQPLAAQLSLNTL